MRGFSFFRWNGGSGEIRGSQVANYIGARVNPTDNYQDDICIWVKGQPPEEFPKHSWLDLMDAPQRVSWLLRHRNIGVIAISKTALNYLTRKLRRFDVRLIPEHHCNYDREQRDHDEIRTVGVIGNRNAFHEFNPTITERFAEMGLEFVYQTEYRNREDVLRFYRNLDIQTVYRPHIRKVDQHLRNPLKLENAGSFGIPSVAYPEEDYAAEFDGCFIPALTIEDIFAQVKRLQEDKILYRDTAQKAQERAEEYHIEKISKLYLELEGIEPVDYLTKAKLLDKEIVADGRKYQVMGLASFRTEPRGRGIGRVALRQFEELAKQEGKFCVFCFCSDDVRDFYIKSGWYLCGRHGAKNLIASIPLTNVQVSEEW